MSTESQHYVGRADRVHSDMQLRIAHLQREMLRLRKREVEERGRSTRQNVIHSAKIRAIGEIFGAPAADKYAALLETHKRAKQHNQRLDRFEASFLRFSKNPDNTSLVFLNKAAKKLERDGEAIRSTYKRLSNDYDKVVSELVADPKKRQKFQSILDDELLKSTAQTIGRTLKALEQAIVQGYKILYGLKVLGQQSVSMKIEPGALLPSPADRQKFDHMVALAKQKDEISRAR